MKLTPASHLEKLVMQIAQLELLGIFLFMCGEKMRKLCICQDDYGG